MPSSKTPHALSPYAREIALLASICVLLAVPFFTNQGFYRFSVFQGMVLDNLSVLIAAVGMTIVIAISRIWL